MREREEEEMREREEMKEREETVGFFVFPYCSCLRRLSLPLRRCRLTSVNLF